jgi:hypothetical protein
MMKKVEFVRAWSKLKDIKPFFRFWFKTKLKLVKPMQNHSQMIHIDEIYRLIENIWFEGLGLGQTIEPFNIFHNFPLIFSFSN